jgi:hypothetical protein
MIDSSMAADISPSKQGGSKRGAAGMVRTAATFASASATSAGAGKVAGGVRPSLPAGVKVRDLLAITSVLM